MTKKCELCKGWGYCWPPGDGSPFRCPACEGDKLSRRPEPTREEGKTDDLELV